MTFMETSLANELNLKPVETEEVELSWLNSKTTKSQTPIINCQIKGRNIQREPSLLKKVRLMDQLKLPCQTFKLNEVVKQYPQLAGLTLRSLTNAKPRILIAMETSLGWKKYGPSSQGLMNQQNKPILFLHGNQIEQGHKISRHQADELDVLELQNSCAVPRSFTEAGMSSTQSEFII